MARHLSDVERRAADHDPTEAVGPTGATITVTVALHLWTGNGGSWHFITVPAERSDEIRAHCFAAMRGFKSARVEATINGVTWRTSVFPQKSGGYFLPVKKEVRCRAGIAAGDEVTVELQLL